MSKGYGLLLGLGAAALFGVSTPLNKVLLGSLGPNLLAGLLYLGGAALLAPYALWERSRRSPHEQPPPLSRADRLRLGGAVLFGGVVGPVLLLLGLARAKAGSVALLLNLETVATALLAVTLFREHLGRWSWIGNAVVFLGGVLLAAETGGPGLVAGLLVAGAAVAWGLDNNLTALIGGISPAASTMVKGLVAGSVNLAVGLALHPALPSWSWLWALAVGGLCYGVSIALYIGAARGMGATRSQMVFSTAPVFGVLVAVGWLGEEFTLAQGAAAGLIALGLALLLIEQHEHRHHHEPLQHDHAHEHGDGHHDHEHPGPGGPFRGRHSHPHRHQPRTHSHAHWPDLHHRHGHRHDGDS